MRLTTQVEIHKAEMVIQDIHLGDELLSVTLKQAAHHLIIQVGAVHQITVDKYGVVQFQRRVGAEWHDLQQKDGGFLYHPERPYQSTGRVLVQIPTGIGQED